MSGVEGSAAGIRMGDHYYKAFVRGSARVRPFREDDYA